MYYVNAKSNKYGGVVSCLQCNQCLQCLHAHICNAYNKSPQLSVASPQLSVASPQLSVALNRYKKRQYKVT
jgi:hypothetical protein